MPASRDVWFISPICDIIELENRATVCVGAGGIGNIADNKSEFIHHNEQRSVIANRHFPFYPLQYWRKNDVLAWWWWRWIWIVNYTKTFVSSCRKKRLSTKMLTLEPLKPWHSTRASSWWLKLKQNEIYALAYVIVIRVCWGLRDAKLDFESSWLLVENTFNEHDKQAFGF